MHVTYGTEKDHAAKLKAGLVALGPGFLAEICYWCDGTTTRCFECCDVCGRGKPYGTSLGLLMGNKPAPESVVNQALVAADAPGQGGPTAPQ